MPVSVFSIEHPEKFYMRKELSSRTKCRDLDIDGWETKKMDELNDALMEYFIEKLVGATKHRTVASFLKKRTFRHNERKECPNEKRERGFAEQEKEKLVREDRN